MDYSLLVGIHDTEANDSSEPEEDDNEDAAAAGTATTTDGDGGATTGDDSGDGIDESTDRGETGPAAEERRQRYSRTESVSSSDGYEAEYFAVHCSDGLLIRLFSLNLLYCCHKAF